MPNVVMATQVVPNDANIQKYQTLFLIFHQIFEIKNEHKIEHLLKHIKHANQYVENAHKKMKAFYLQPYVIGKHIYHLIILDTHVRTCVTYISTFRVFSIRLLLVQEIILGIICKKQISIIYTSIYQSFDSPPFEDIFNFMFFQFITFFQETVFYT